MKPNLLDTTLPDPEPDDGPVLNLRQEVAATREVLDGLMALWRGQAAPTIDDARRLSVLVFNGARTVAVLLAHHIRLNSHAPDNDWLDAVLEELHGEIGGE